MITLIENNLLKLWAWTFLAFIPPYTIIAFMIQSAESDLLERLRSDKRREKISDKLGNSS